MSCNQRKQCLQHCKHFVVCSLGLNDVLFCNRGVTLYCHQSLIKNGCQQLCSSCAIMNCPLTTWLEGRHLPTKTCKVASAMDNFKEFLFYTKSFKQRPLLLVLMMLVSFQVCQKNQSSINPQVAQGTIVWLHFSLAKIALGMMVSFFAGAHTKWRHNECVIRQHKSTLSHHGSTMIIEHMMPLTKNGYRYIYIYI